MVEQYRRAFIPGVICILTFGEKFRATPTIINPCNNRKLYRSHPDVLRNALSRDIVLTPQSPSKLHLSRVGADDLNISRVFDCV